MKDKFIGECNICGKVGEIDLDFGGCNECAKQYVKECDEK